MSEELMTDSENTQTADVENVAVDTSVSQQETEQMVDASETSAPKNSVPTIPESYEFTAQFNGKPYPQEYLNIFSDVAKSAGLNNEQANLVLDHFTQHIMQIAIDREQQQHNHWVQSSQTDKEFGGERFNENLAVAKRALTAFGTPELTQYLDESGLGNHPEMIRLMYRVGKQIGEDHFVNGQKGESFSDARAFYPNTKLNP